MRQNWRGRRDRQSDAAGTTGRDIAQKASDESRGGGEDYTAKKAKDAKTSDPR